MDSGAQQLARWMKRSTRNQREAAAFLGLHWTIVNKYFKGHRSPSRETAILIEEKTGIPVAAWSTRVGKRQKRNGHNAKRANVGTVTTHV